VLVGGPGQRGLTARPTQVALVQLQAELRGEEVVDEEPDEALDELQAVADGGEVLVLVGVGHVGLPHQAGQQDDQAHGHGAGDVEQRHADGHERELVVLAAALVGGERLGRPGRRARGGGGVPGGRRLAAAAEERPHTGQARGARGPARLARTRLVLHAVARVLDDEDERDVGDYEHDYGEDARGQLLEDVVVAEPERSRDQLVGVGKTS